MCLNVTERREYLKIERIARSRLTEVIFHATKSGELSDSDLTAMFMSIIETFANGKCMWLASALATETGWPIVAFFRRSRPDDLAHAAVVCPTTLDAFDVLGVTSVSDMRSQLAAAIGPMRIERPHPMPLPDDEREALLTICAGFPWLPDTGRKRPPLSEWASLLRRYAAR